MKRDGGSARAVAGWGTHPATNQFVTARQKSQGAPKSQGPGLSTSSAGPQSPQPHTEMTLGTPQAPGHQEPLPSWLSPTGGLGALSTATPGPPGSGCRPAPPPGLSPDSCTQELLNTCSLTCPGPCARARGEGGPRFT